MQPTSKILSGLMGLCVGDALGVPVEFTSRAERVKMPVTEMTGYGTYNQPPGTWSDDSSLTFCLANSLCAGFSLEAIGDAFGWWYSEGYWTPYGEVFDVGNTTRQAITNLQRGVLPLNAGLTSASNNGNGSLMRILPLSFYYKNLSFSELIERVHQVSRITHGHCRSQIACGIYTSIAINLLKRLDPKSAYLQGIKNIKSIYTQPVTVREINSHFHRVFSGNIETLSIDEIHSTGYVIHTLEAALWCLLNTSSYAESVLKAVNLGEDTDTTAAVTGGLAGIYYGLENIPKEWVAQIARKDDIVALATRLEAAINSSSKK
ncbi:ADP-ribosylglycohydrolase family protein [Microcoleus sp. FACHB-672]|uniref:ADP-ribosylglycohydrolase family protein n=1 Tax=Microcoleus sp. FACHB-672 TaxID=2692825 RepID=UPI0016839CF8|nr:ADP-ribosylglycohydrolase family protein [Microcoleus sp. FACHB-672]MBD2039971.1 ADP-ribosylglycohydrolase family protein [Microcoleus sp. FACHB-672]